LGVAGGHESLARAKDHVERSYPGIGKHWTDTNISKDAANAYLKDQWGDDVCLFCGRMPHEVVQLFVGPNGRICDVCVREFRALLTHEA
jgi:hypothetical protein